MRFCFALLYAPPVTPTQPVALPRHIPGRGTRTRLAYETITPLSHPSEVPPDRLFFVLAVCFLLFFVLERKSLSGGFLFRDRCLPAKGAEFFSGQGPPNLCLAPKFSSSFKNPPVGAASPIPHHVISATLVSLTPQPGPVHSPSSVCPFSHGTSSREH